MSSFAFRRMLVVKTWIERVYRHHVIRYGDLHERDYRLVVWTAAITSVLVVSAVGACLARSDYQRYIEQSQVAKARQFLLQGAYAKAAASAGRALALNPADLQACRIMADTAAFSHLPTELFWAQRLADMEPTVDNKLRLAETAIHLQSTPFPLAALILNELATTAGNNPGFHAVAGQLAVRLHLAAAAESQYAAALRLDPANQQYDLNLATVQLNSDSAAEKTSACQRLEKLGLDPSLGAAALRVLIADRVTARDDASASRYSEQVLATPQATLTDRLQNLEIVQRNNQAGFADRLHSVQDLAATDAASVGALSGWMQTNGLAADNLDWLLELPNNIQITQTFKLAMAQAYMQNGKWQALLDFATQDNWGDKEFLRLAMLSRAWSQLGVPTVALANWGEAVKVAGTRYTAMTNLLALAQRWQLPDAQLDVRHRLMQLAPE